MFTGIIEAMATVTAINKQQQNVTFTLKAPFLKELKIDQSIAHNGVCLTVDGLQEDTYTVTAIQETLQRTNLGLVQVGDLINLERCLRLGDRLDGHLVQGHVDQTGICTRIENAHGSWNFWFEYDSSSGNLTVEKGSICINGVSLTVVESTSNGFSVSIIPYTFEHTTFATLKIGSVVNLEFDILGKYIQKLHQRQPANSQ